MVTDDICTTDVSIIASPLPSSLPPVPPALSSSSTMPQKLSYKGREDLNLLPFGAANDWVLSAPFPSRSQAHVLVDKLLSSGLESELSNGDIIKLRYGTHEKYIASVPSTIRIHRNDMIQRRLPLVYEQRDAKATATFSRHLKGYSKDATEPVNSFFEKHLDNSKRKREPLVSFDACLTAVIQQQPFSNMRALLYSAADICGISTSDADTLVACLVRNVLDVENISIHPCPIKSLSLGKMIPGSCFNEATSDILSIKKHVHIGGFLILFIAFFGFVM